jgi:hypothetical protein
LLIKGYIGVRHTDEFPEMWNSYHIRARKLLNSFTEMNCGGRFIHLSRLNVIVDSVWSERVA